MAKHNQERKIIKKHRHDLPKIKILEGILVSVIAAMVLLVLYVTVLVPEASFESIAEEIEMVTQEAGADNQNDLYTNDIDTPEESENSEEEGVTAEFIDDDEVPSSDENEESEDYEDEAEDSTEEVMTLSLDEPQDLVAYLNEHGGEVRERVIRDGEFLEPDPDGSYPGIFGADFEYNLTIHAPYGILEGIYTYQIPEDILIAEEDREEQDIYDEEDNYMGIRSIDENGLLVIQISDEMNDKTDVTGFISCNASIIPKGDVEEPVEARVEKDGEFNPEDGKFHFTITAEIPAYDGVQYKAWYLYDQYELQNNYNYEDQDLSKAEIHIRFNGSEKTLHSIDDAISFGEKFAYYYEDNKLYLINKCECNNNNCMYRSSDDSCPMDSIQNGWCSCWNLACNATLIISYYNEDSSNILTLSNGQNYHNRALLTEMITDENIYSDVKIPIPSFISKSLTTKPTASNNYTAKYKLVINQDKIDLSSKENLTVEDVISSASYVPGSISVVATDKSGKNRTLVYGTDYSFEYKDHDADSKERGFDLTLFNPGAYSYTVTYQAMVVGSTVGKEETVTVSNTATLLLYGSLSSSYSFNYGFTEGWSYKSLTVNIIKKDSLYDDVLLKDAVFDLYSSEGQKLGEQTTDETGKATFTTDIANDVVLRTDTAYFIKEIAAPSGYQLDDTEYWFYANSTRDTKLESTYPFIHWIKVSTSRKTQGDITMTNVAIPRLPETGMDYRDYLGIGIVLGTVLFSLGKLIICAI